MIIVKLMGGMCNQMFQNAYGMALESLGHQVQYDRHALIEQTHREYSLTKFGGVEFGTPEGPVFQEKSLRFDGNNLFPPDPAVAVGYWQCENYFKHIAADVRKRFTLRGAPSDSAFEYWKKIYTADSGSVALHVRRGDYVGLQLFHGLPTLTYYKEALAYIQARVPDTKVFIFSDDPTWCLENFMGYDVVQGTDKYEDLWLMSSCKHAILANSSFSWWGAWLGCPWHNRIVVAPKQWFADPSVDSSTICPERWVRI